ncbi:MAG: RidA family protein [Chroococcidiopsidaceae cyanobacterium CP_BM_ER_R8_30]|nr:RidA family protein [Chroococcidiopsidaceae cyanobacterium CP_BM_ER_R8_30]
MLRQLVSSGSPWESVVGYSRAVRAGNLVFVAGTTAATADGKVLGPNDAYLQTQEILRRIELALLEVGATVQDVVQTRIYVTDINRWQEIGRAHGEVFGEVRPVTAMVEVQRLIAPEMLVEIEALAVLPGAELGQ